MKTTSKIFILGLVMVMALCYANPVSAESDFATGGADAAVNLDFQIIIPQFIYFRVGDSVTVDQIIFSPSADEVYSGTHGIAGTGGDLGSGVVSVVLISNVGNIDITETNDGGGSGLIDGSNSISYTRITTTSSNAASLPAPPLSDLGGTFVTITPNVGTSVINRSEQWTYEYNNPAVPPAAGTYNGRVTYTASIP